MVFRPTSRIVGIDDGPFGSCPGCRVPLVGVRHAARRARVMERAGPIHEADGRFFQVAGASQGTARRILSIASPYGAYPEALRLAHLIAGAWVNGSSRGGA